MEARGRGSFIVTGATASVRGTIAVMCWCLTVVVGGVGVVVVVVVMVVVVVVVVVMLFRFFLSLLLRRLVLPFLLFLKPCVVRQRMCARVCAHALCALGLVCVCACACARRA
jgi:hypothetical protein